MVVGELVRRGSRTPRDRSIVHCVINVGEMGRLVRRGGFEGTVDFEVGAALASQWPIHRVDSRVTSSLLLQSNEHLELDVEIALVHKREQAKSKAPPAPLNAKTLDRARMVRALSTSSRHCRHSHRHISYIRCFPFVLLTHSESLSQGN